MTALTPLSADEQLDGAAQPQTAHERPLRPGAAPARLDGSWLNSVTQRDSVR